MMYLIVQIFDLLQDLLEHFALATNTYFIMGTDYQWSGNVVSTVTQKGTETVGALSTVVHLGSIFLAQLMNFLVFPFYNTVAGPSTAQPLYTPPFG